MNIIYNRIFLEHDTGMHPENRKRIESLGTIPETEISSGDKYLTLIHTPEYIERVKTSCQKSERLDQDTVTSPGTYEAAVMAVGATVMASESGGFALVRPPGHHAHPDRSGGFCIFNNIAIATKKLADSGKKVMIVDIDSHLGDGTEKIFYNSDRMLYASLHQDPSFPGGGAVEDVGYGSGAGFTVNIPLSPGSGDDIYLEGLKLIGAVGKQFRPDVVGVSAGFDGHEHDLLLNLRLSINSYYEAGKMLRQTFGNVFATLEGGYNVDLFPRCLFSFLAGCDGDEIPFSEDKTESTILVMEEFQVRMARLKEILSPYWKL
jgi:acetoin utilization deacetylase AcuC-like enzyme